MAQFPDGVNVSTHRTGRQGGLDASLRNAAWKPARGSTGTVAAAVAALAAVGSPTGTLTVHVPGGEVVVTVTDACFLREAVGVGPQVSLERLVERDGVIPGWRHARQIQGARPARHVPPSGTAATYQIRPQAGLSDFTGLGEYSLSKGQIGAAPGCRVVDRELVSRWVP